MVLVKKEKKVRLEYLFLTKRILRFPLTPVVQQDGEHRDLIFTSNPQCARWRCPHEASIADYVAYKARFGLVYLPVFQGHLHT